MHCWYSRATKIEPVADAGGGPRIHSSHPGRIGSLALGAWPQLLVMRGPLWLSAVERWVCKPRIQSIRGHILNEIWRLTLPRAHSDISFKGSRARWIEVVHNHTGSPRRMTMAQNDRITHVRVRILLGSSGGGCFAGLIADASL